MRARIAAGVVVLYGIVILTLLASLILNAITLDEMKEAAALLLGPLTGVVGGVAGFYYGSAPR